MPVGRSRQGTNQAGALAPLTSAWGQALDAARGQLVDQPLPIGTRPNNFGGTVGGVVTIQASTKTVIGSQGYFGDTPQSLQDEVDVPPPWERV